MYLIQTYIELLSIQKIFYDKKKPLFLERPDFNEIAFPKNLLFADFRE